MHGYRENYSHLFRLLAFLLLEVMLIRFTPAIILVLHLVVCCTWIQIEEIQLHWDLFVRINLVKKGVSFVCSLNGPGDDMPSLADLELQPSHGGRRLVDVLRSPLCHLQH
jgi:hypothetical protein